MSKVQDGLPVHGAGSASPDPVPAYLSVPAVKGPGEAWDQSGMDDSAGSGGQTLLSRPAAPQGPRSLFRR